MQSVITGRPIGRPKQFYKYELPQGVIKVVRAQCADYDRKALAIREGNIAAETLQSYIKRMRQSTRLFPKSRRAVAPTFLLILPITGVTTVVRYSSICRTTLTTTESGKRYLK